MKKIINVKITKTTTGALKKPLIAFVAGYIKTFDAKITTFFANITKAENTKI